MREKNDQMNNRKNNKRRSKEKQRKIAVIDLKSHKILQKYTKIYFNFKITEIPFFYEENVQHVYCFY